MTFTLKALKLNKTLKQKYYAKILCKLKGGHGRSPEDYTQMQPTKSTYTIQHVYKVKTMNPETYPQA